MDEIRRKVCAKLIIGLKTYPIYMGVNTIGRNRDAVVTIKNLNVSHHQALIVVIDDAQHFISDMKSSNGTSMNNTKLAPFNLYQLKDNAEVIFGDVKATYLIVTSHSSLADSSQMDLTCVASQTQTQTFFASTTQLIENRQNMSQETEVYSNELETQEADYPLLPNPNITTKVTNATPVHDYIFLKPKDLNNKQQCSPGNAETTSKEIVVADCRPASVELVPSESLDAETELIVQNECLDRQTNTESTEMILTEGVLESNSPNAPTLSDGIQACDQQVENPSEPDTSLGKITMNISSDIYSIAPEYPKGNSSLVENLQVTNKELDSSHIEAKKNVTDASTIPQSIFTLSRKSLALGGTLCNESTDDISHTSTSSGIGEQLVNDSTVNTNSDSNDSIDFLKLNDQDILSKSRFITFRKNEGSKLKSNSVGRVVSDSDSDSDDFVPIQKKKTTKLNSDCDSPIESTQEIGYRRKSVKKLDSDESQLDNSGSETDCEEELMKVMGSERKNSIVNEEKLFDDSECIPATQDIFIETIEHSKEKPTCSNLTAHHEALEGKELLISDGKEVKTTNHSSEESFKLGISEYILDEADKEVNKIMSINGDLESQGVNSDKIITPGEEVLKENDEIAHQTNKGQEKDTNHTNLLLNNNQSGLNKVADFLIPSQNFNDELYAISTQKLTQNECFPGLPKPFTVDSENDDIYLMSTQPLKPTERLSQSQTTKKYAFKKKAVNLNESLNTLLGSKECVGGDVITQQIDGNGNKEATNENLGTSKENDIFIQPTQCISTSVENAPKRLIDDCFVMPTQPLSTQTLVGDLSDHKDVDDHFRDLKKNKSPKDDQKKSSTSTNQCLNSSTEILFEDLEASQDHVDDDFLIPPQPFRAEVIGASKTLVAGSPGKSPKNTSGESYAETLSQIDTFVKQSCSKSKPTKDIINENVVENYEETLSQIDTFVKQTFIKPKERCCEVLKDTNKTLSEMPSKNQNKDSECSKCGANRIDDIEESRSINNILGSIGDVSTNDHLHGAPNFSSTLKDESETLSQIEEFVKSTGVDLKNTTNKGESAKNTSRPTRIKNIPILNSPKKAVTKATRSYKRKVPIKEVNHTVENLSESSDDDFVDSTNQKKGKRDEVKQDINQTYIQMLESKNTKIIKSNKNPTGVVELKVTAGSNRRSMNITESSCIGVSTRNSKRKIEQTSAASNSKRQPKETCDISKPKTGRKAKGRVLSSSQVPNVQPNLTNSEITTVNDKTTELMTSENQHNERSVPPKKRKYTKKAANKEMNNTTETSTSIKQSRRKLTDTDDQLDTTNTTRNRTRNPDVTSTCSSTPVKQSRNKSTNDTDDQLDATNTPKNRTRNLDVTSNCSSSERSKRKQRPKVVFTMLDDPQLESLIKRMGGSVVDTVDKCTVLITEQVKRSVKLLQAIGQGKPICSPAWLHASKREHDFLDPWDFILIDKEAETKWKFSLKESLTRARGKKLLDNYVFQILTSTALDVLKGAIEVCGGKCVAKYPVDKRNGLFFVIASPDQKSKYSRLVKQHPDLQIIEPEAIFDGVLRQELRFDRHLLQ